MTVVASREEWIPQLERLVAAYRAIGVRSADPVELDVSDLTPRLAQASVRWALRDASGGAIYEFRASYTLADRGEGTRIVVIVHDEAARLRSAAERRRRES